MDDDGLGLLNVEWLVPPKGVDHEGAQCVTQCVKLKQTDGKALDEASEALDAKPRGFNCVSDRHLDRRR